MAEGDGGVPNKFLERLMLGEIDHVDDTIMVALMAAGHTPGRGKYGGNVGRD